MILKKFLQKQAEKDAETLLTEEDKLFIQQLVQNDECMVGVLCVCRMRKRRRDEKLL